MNALSVAAWRNEIGQSAALWVGKGRHTVAPDMWVALSGTDVIDYNVALVHGSDRESVARGMEEVLATGRPSLIMIAGEALGNIQVLVDAAWVCVGAQPLMVLPSLADARFTADDAVRRATASDLGKVRAVAAEVFGMSSATSDGAFPDDLVGSVDNAAWILEEGGDPRAVVSTGLTGSAMAVWSMATLPRWRRRGFGQRLLGAALADACARGADHSVLLSTPAGQPLYQGLGYQIIEWWQVWSRRRWVLPA